VEAAEDRVFLAGGAAPGVAAAVVETVADAIDGGAVPTGSDDAIVGGDDDGATTDAGAGGVTGVAAGDSAGGCVDVAAAIVAMSKEEDGDAQM